MARLQTDRQAINPLCFTACPSRSSSATRCRRPIPTVAELDPVRPESARRAADTCGFDGHRPLCAIGAARRSATDAEPIAHDDETADALPRRRPPSGSRPPRPDRRGPRAGFDFLPGFAEPDMTASPFAYRLEQPADNDEIEALHAEAFGPGRFARAAFRLREDVPHDPGALLRRARWRRVRRLGPADADPDRRPAGAAPRAAGGQAGAQGPRGREAAGADRGGGGAGSAATASCSSSATSPTMARSASRGSRGTRSSSPPRSTPTGCWSRG